MKSILKRYYLPVLFIAFIFFSLTDKMLNFTKDIENNENKKATEKPEFDINHLDNFPSKYEAFFNSNFTLRNYFIKYFNQAVITYLGKSPLPDKVIFGKNDWLFYGDKHLDFYRGIERFEKDELIDMKKELFYRYEYLKKRGIKYYFIILPTKYTIYPEYLNDDIIRLCNNTLTDQLIDAMGKNLPFTLIDTRKALIDAKKYNIRLFQKTDSHWNFAGGYFAYHYISQFLKKDFPEIKIKEINEYKFDSVLQKGGDIAKMLGNEDKYKENFIFATPLYSNVKEGKKSGYDPKGFPISMNPYELVYINPEMIKPKGLIIHDSFTEILIPFIKEDFAKSVYIFDRWEYGLNEDIIEKEKPDIFINIVLECHLKNILQHLSYNKK